MDNKTTVDTLVTSPSFCPKCGTILPLLQELGDVVCYQCREHFKPEIYGNSKIKYTIHFNSIEAYTKNMEEDKLKNDSSETDGPIVERKCPKCGHYEMTYATIQLRSADEGQTVFYTCTKCKFKENENS